MMPCSSGNSPTISVSRSALARRAASSASALSASSIRAIVPDNVAIRSTRCNCVPSLLWYTTLPSFSTRDSSGCLRSLLKKNFASAKRGRTTRSLPPITRLASVGRMLDTIRNLLVSLSFASSSGKYFWFAFIVRIRHSCGTAKYSDSNVPTNTLGRSTSAVTSSSNASSLMGFTPPPTLAAASANWREISAQRFSKLGITAPSFSICAS